MLKPHIGGSVRVKTMAEICAIYNTDEERIMADEPRLGSIRFMNAMIKYCGNQFRVMSVDADDNTVCLEDPDDPECDYWFDFDMVEVIPFKGELFGFKVGDEVEFSMYEDMREDGRLNYNWFTYEMRYLCGTRVKILDLIPYERRFAEVVIEPDDDRRWSYTTSMFEHAGNLCEVKEDDWLKIFG